jgi:hypothetical protein
MADELIFDWDPANVGHIAREEAEQVLRNTPIRVEESERNAEIRTVALGEPMRDACWLSLPLCGTEKFAS